MSSIESLRRRGRHVQIGLLPGLTALPMNRVIGYELELLGSHGMAAHAYPAMLKAVMDGELRPDLLLTRSIGLDEAGPALAAIRPGRHDDPADAIGALVRIAETRAGRRVAVPCPYRRISRYGHADITSKKRRNTGFTPTKCDERGDNVTGHAPRRSRLDAHPRQRHASR